MAGGYEGSTESKTVESTLDGNSFTNRPSLPGSLAHGCMVAVDEIDLYATGGKSSVNMVYRIAKGEASWTILPHMPTARCVVQVVGSDWPYAKY